MRVTSQMLANSNMEAGIGTTGTKTLADYIGTDNDDNSILNCLTGDITQAQTSSYSRIKSSADDFSEAIKALSDESLESAVTSEDTSEVIENVKKFVSGFNSLISSLAKTGNTLNNYYKNSLNSLVSSNESALSKIGISLNKSGLLETDSDTLSSAAATDLQNVFTSDSTFMEHISYVTEHVYDNASSNTSSLTATAYNAVGKLFSAYESKYDEKS